MKRHGLTDKQRIALQAVVAREVYANGPMAVDVAAALHPERAARSWSDVGAATALLGGLERQGLLRSCCARVDRLTGPSPCG